MDTLERDLQRLSPELRREVHDFVQFLLTKHGTKADQHLRLDWRDALQDLKEDYDSDEKLATSGIRSDIDQVLTDFLASHDLSALQDAVGDDAVSYVRQLRGWGDDDER